MEVYRSGLKLFVLLLAGLSVTSCIPGGTGDTEVSPQTIETIDDTNRLRDPSGQVEVELPSGWQEAPEKTLHDSADLYAQNEGEELYLVVVGESAAEVQAGSKELVAYRYRQLITDALDTSQDPVPTDAGQVGGYPAIQYEIRGSLDGKDIVYLHSTVFVEDTYYQVVGWTTAERYERNKEELQRIVNSFSQL